MQIKTIMIDGVNVKDCAFLHSEICCDIDDEYCFKDNNCYFKQLTRAKLENKQLKDILKHASEYSYIMRAYILDVKRTMPDELKKQDRINNICYGLGGESGEILDYLKKVFYHKQVFNPKILSEEIGDLFWYICALMYEYDLDFTQILRQNIEKRKKRYPNGFNPLDSLLRKDKDNE